MRVRVADTFVESASRLDGPARAAVKRVAFDYLAGPARPGLRLHRLVHALDHGFWSLRVSRDLRIIVHRDGDAVVLCYAGHHDRAYEWASQRVGAPGCSGPVATIDRAGTTVRASDPASGSARVSSPAPSGRGDAAPVREESLRCPRVDASRRDLRLVRRATARLPTTVEPVARATAPAPLVHLLRAFQERRPGRGPGSGDGTPVPRPALRTAEGARGEHRGSDRSSRVLGSGAWKVAAVLLPWIVAAWLGLARSAAAALAIGSALWTGWLLRSRKRAAALEVVDAEREVEARLETLAAAMESVLRGDAPELPRTGPAGALRRAWAVVEQLGRFFALDAGDLRVLAGRAVGSAPAGGPPREAGTEGTRR